MKAGNDEKATLVRGGKRLTGEGYDKGYFYEPTIFDQVDNRMKIAQEEIFGPVLSVIPFKDADEALRMANDSMYGLAAAVWTKDIDKRVQVREGDQGRHRLDQQLPRGGDARRAADAVRRLQAVGHRAGAGAGGAGGGSWRRSRVSLKLN